MVTQVVVVSPQTSVQAPARKARPLRLHERLILDQEEQIKELQAENRQLLEQVRRYEEEHEAGACPCTQRIAGLEAELEQAQETHRQELEGSYWYNRHQGFIEWVRALFANKTIPMACKLVFLQYYLIFTSMRAPAFGEKMKVCMQDVAAHLGIDTSTVRRATDKAQTHGILEREYEPLTLANGDKRTNIYLTLDAVLARPDDIEMEKLHGGARAKRCPKCGSEDVDRYTVQYCRDCDENDWYLQPTTRNDAPWQEAQQAKNRAPYGKGAAITDDFAQKQDAFLADLAVVISEPAVEPEQQNVVDQAAAIADDLSQKQDAFDDLAQKIERQMAAAPGYQFHHEKTQRPWRCLTPGCCGQNFQWVDALGDWWCPTCRERQTLPLQV